VVFIIWLMIYLTKLFVNAGQVNWFYTAGV